MKTFLTLFFLDKVPLKVKEKSCCKTLCHTIITVEVDGNEKKQVLTEISKAHEAQNENVGGPLIKSIFIFRANRRPLN